MRIENTYLNVLISYCEDWLQNKIIVTGFIAAEIEHRTDVIKN